MAIALLGYFGSMVAALVGMVMLLNALAAYVPINRLNPRSHPRPAIAQAFDADDAVRRSAASVVQAPSDVATAKTAAPVRTAAARADAERRKRLKIARYRQRQLLAREREQRPDRVALGYGQQPSYLPNFGPFGAGRF